MGVPRVAHPPADPHPHQRQGAEAEERAVRDGRVLTKALLCISHLQPLRLVTVSLVCWHKSCQTKKSPENFWTVKAQQKKVGNIQSLVLKYTLELSLSDLII